MRAPLPTTKPRSAGAFSVKAKMHLFKLFWFLGEHATLKPSRVKGLKSFQEVMMEKEKNGKQVPENEKVQRLTIWLDPGVVRRVDGWLYDDNCKNRSEFISKALRFYMGYLSTEDTSMYLSKALVTTLRGLIADNANRLRSLLFKWAVELNMTTHTVAAHFGASVKDRAELRRFAVEEVKRSNGQISFDHALDVQCQLPLNEWQE